MSEPTLSDHERIHAVMKVEQHEYHAAIGRLMLKWVLIERQLYLLLLRYGNLSDAVGRALLSGTRAKAMTEFLMAIAHNAKLPNARVKDLECVFAQVVTINTMRDRIVHHGSWAFQGTFSTGHEDSFDQFITNRERAMRGQANSFVVSVSRKSIDLMVADLETILHHLDRHLSKKKFLPYRKGPDASTWLYKFPQPIDKKGKFHAAPRKPSARHRPSQK